jgi:hypothetical protein
MDMELTLFAIQRERDTAAEQLTRARHARAGQSVSTRNRQVLGGPRLLPRASRAFARMLLHQAPSRRQA